MVTAFVFLNIDQGAEKEALKQLRVLSEVQEAYQVYGVFDIVTRLELNSIDQLKEAIRKVRAIDKVRSTVTTLVP